MALASSSSPKTKAWSRTPPPHSLSSQSRARATGGDALGEVRLVRPLVGQAVAAPVAGERGLPPEDAWERPEVGEGLAKPAQSSCVAQSAWPPLPFSGAGGGGAASAAPRASVSVIPSCRQGCAREANPTQTPCSGDVATPCSGDVLATFRWPLERRKNVARTGCWTVAGTVENRHSYARAQGTLRALRPRGWGGGGASTTNGTILAPLWACGKNNDWGVVRFSPSHQQQRILAPLWAWGKNNDLEVLGFSPSHQQQGILAPLWAWGKNNDLGVLGFSPSHQQPRILALLGEWGRNNDWGVLGFSPSHPHSSNS